jgi:hypothetical protein
MGSKRVTGGAGDYLRSFSTEDGNHYRGFHQNFDPAIRRVEMIREARARLTKANNPYDRQYIGSVPVTLILDWCAKNGFTYDQFARREGDIRQRFMRYYLSRDFSKLHTQHTTTRRESSRIVVPNYIGRKHDNQLRHSEDGGSSVA